MFFWRKKKEKEIVEESKTEKLILTASEQDELDNYIDGIKNDTDFDKILKDTEPKVVKKFEPKIEAEILPKLKKVEPKIVTKIDKTESINCIEFNTIYTGEKYVLFEFSKDVWSHTYKISGKSKNGNYIFVPDITDDLNLSIEIVDYNVLKMEIKFFDKFIHSIGKSVTALQMLEKFCLCLDGMQSIDLNLTSGNKIVKLGNKFIKIELMDILGCRILLSMNLSDKNSETVKRFLKMFADASNALKSQYPNSQVAVKLDNLKPFLGTKPIKTPSNWNWETRKISKKSNDFQIDEQTYKKHLSEYVTELRNHGNILVNTLLNYMKASFHSVRILQNEQVYDLVGTTFSENFTTIEINFLKNSINWENLKEIRKIGNIQKVEIILSVVDYRTGKKGTFEIDLDRIKIVDLENDDIIFSIDCSNGLGLVQRETQKFHFEKHDYKSYQDYLANQLNMSIKEIGNSAVSSIQIETNFKSNSRNYFINTQIEYANIKTKIEYVEEQHLKLNLKFFDAGIKKELNQYITASHFLELFREEFENLKSITIILVNGQTIVVESKNVKIEKMDKVHCEILVTLNLSKVEYVLKSGEFYFYRFDWVENFGISKMKQITKTGKDLNLARRYTKERFDKIFNNGLSDGWELVKYEDAKKSEENFKKIETQLAKPIVTEKPIIKKSSLLQTVAVDNIVEIVFVTNSGENYKVPICKIYVNYEIDAASKELNLTFWTKNDYKSYGNYISAKLTNSFDIKLVCKSGKIYTILGNRISKFKLKTLTDFLTIKDFEI